MFHYGSNSKKFKRMNQLRLLLLFLISLHFLSSVEAQTKGDFWFYGLDIMNPNMTQFDYERGKIGVAEQRVSTQVWLERRFKQRLRGPFLYQNGLRLELQSFSRSGIGNDGLPVSSGWLRVPLMWMQHMPRFIKDDKHPIFEMQTGIGYYLAKPYYYDTLSFLLTDHNYWSHGVQAMIGLNFYIQSGSAIQLGWRINFDAGRIGENSENAALQYQDAGFSIGFSSSFADTSRRMKAVKAWRNARRSRK